MSTSPHHEAASSRPDPLKPVEVPVFSCVVYVAKNASGGVHARVANLAGLECDAGSEREALSKLVPAFKQRMTELAASNTPIPWIEPPSPKRVDEQVRLVPVHL
ncbi:MAG: hypothetical protein ABI614_03305 [Planctomycetota bacterium]